MELAARNQRGGHEFAWHQDPCLRVRGWPMIPAMGGTSKCSAAAASTASVSRPPNNTAVGAAAPAASAIRAQAPPSGREGPPQAALAGRRQEDLDSVELREHSFRQSGSESLSILIFFWNRLCVNNSRRN